MEANRLRMSIFNSCTVVCGEKMVKLGYNTANIDPENECLQVVESMLLK